MDKPLAPTARLTLDALRTGPGNVHELCERTGRSRSATDKALAELARAALIVKIDDGGDPADGAPTRWQLTDEARAEGEATTEATAEATEPDTTGDDSSAPPTTDQTGADDADGVEPAATDARASEPAPPDQSHSPADADQTEQAPEPASDGPTTVGAEGHATAAGSSDDGKDGAAKPDGEADQAAETEPPKLCRGCQTQMPKICEHCWQKTPAYCGTCRKDMPQVRRGEPGEPLILSNGLPKLRPGELEQLILKVMREHPLPGFAGVIGWTGGRVAIHLPGRSPSAISNALEKFTKTGDCELIGDKPMRFRLKDTGQTGEQHPNTGNGDGTSEVAHPEAGQPAAGGTTA